MIVPKMTVQEIHGEILNDRRSIPQVKMEDFQKKFKSYVLRSTKFPVVRSYKYKTKQYNTLVVSLSAEKRGNHSTPDIAIHCIYERKEGKYLARWAFGDRSSIFPPHFLDRYQERILKDSTLSRKDVISHFIINNAAIITLEIDDNVKAVYKCFESHNSDERIDFVAAMAEGYCFGEIQGDVKIVKTIISDDMLFPEQRKLFPALRDVLDRSTEVYHINK